MELGYWKERINAVSNVTTEVRRFKSRLIGIAQLYDRFKQDPEQKLRNNLRQLDQEMAFYDKKLDTWTPKPMATAVGIAIMVYFTMYRLYNVRYFAAFYVLGLLCLGLASGFILSIEDSHSAIQSLRAICTSLIYSMDQESSDTRRVSSSE